MRFRVAMVSIGMAVVLGFPMGNVWANSGDEWSNSRSRSVNKAKKTNSDNHKHAWYKKEKTVTSAGPSAAWSERQTRTWEWSREGERPHTYFWTDASGKYDYFADHYGYPYAYGDTPMSPPPANVFGYVPPEQAGGGPVLYHRDHPSW